MLCRGACVAKAALSEFRPQALVAAGGFVSPPVVLAASWLRIPIVLLEPNAAAGRANIALSRFASLIVTAYESARADFPKRARVECLGMPLRYRADPKLRDAKRKQDPSTLVVGLMAGSLGALAMNRAVWEKYPDFAKVEGLRLIHVTGARDFPQAQYAWEKAGSPASIEVRSFQADMPTFYQEVDVILGRGGAMSCQEFIEFSVPALMVPRPNATRNHTWLNTEPLVQAGACVAYKQSEFSGELLLELIQSWKTSPEILEKQRASYAPLRRSDAAEQVAARVLALTSKKQAVAA